MTRYLLDTNIILRFCNRSDLDHTLAVDAVTQLLNQGDECFITAQILIEFWVVATRPVEVNGLGWTTEQVHDIIQQLLVQFPLLEESPDIFPNWLSLVSANKVMGKRTHDARIVAVMLTHAITHLLTFNPKDFTVAQNIIIVHPQELINP
ncbi:MAG: type II toxin-antitoxin system VapC family toxin [Coleofasciculus sp. B1-GNL1-01]|uniref:type II toxin-antitoxin system VapC family toxin n=1 Tax=Coleofasciculus sp. B1-GNL1-01 TaxID=3068484 RepID=UPI003302BBD5